ncbi:MAG: hypothetical protein JWN38_959 [Candidatus Saccharibacteria bacterium]|nr:hypothetical protein [Candidatus Saccharibacteria bacterium]
MRYYIGDVISSDGFASSSHRSSSDLSWFQLGTLNVHHLYVIRKLFRATDNRFWAAQCGA